MIARAKPTHPPQAQADWADCHALQRKLLEHSDALNAMAPETGKAKHVLEFSNDMRKRALARAMAAPLAGGASATAAEAEGRASPAYTQEMGVLAKQHEAAEVTIANYEAKRIAWETCRSLLSMMKTQVGQL